MSEPKWKGVIYAKNHPEGKRIRDGFALDGWLVTTPRGGNNFGRGFAKGMIAPRLLLVGDIDVTPASLEALSHPHLWGDEVVTVGRIGTA